MYIVYYKRDSYNPQHTYPQNFNRFVGSKCFTTVEEARSFAETVAEPHIYSLTGKKIA